MRKHLILFGTGFIWLKKLNAQAFAFEIFQYLNEKCMVVYLYQIRIVICRSTVYVIHNFSFRTCQFML